MAEPPGFIDNVNDLLYVHDLEGNIQWMNRPAQRLLARDGVSDSLNIRDLLHPDSLPIAMEHIQAKAVGQEAASAPYEVRVCLPDGRDAWLEVSSHVINSDSGPVAVQGVARDVTARHWREHATLVVPALAKQLATARHADDAIRHALHALTGSGPFQFGAYWHLYDGTLHAAPVPSHRIGRAGGRLSHLLVNNPMPMDHGVFGSAWHNPVLIDDVQQEPGFPLAGPMGAASLTAVLLVPVRAIDRIGMFTLCAQEWTAEAKGMQTVATQVATLLGTVLERMHSELRMRRQLHRLAALADEAAAAVAIDAAGKAMHANRPFLDMIGVRGAPSSMALDGEQFEQSLDDVEKFQRATHALLAGSASDPVGKWNRRVLRVHDDDDLPAGHLWIFEPKQSAPASRD